MIKPHYVVSTAIITIASSAPLTASAFAPRVTQVPSNNWGCALCHVSAAGGGPRTVFGQDVFQFARAGTNMNWEDVCALDSDGDGATNGAELGDPDCAWRRGDAPIMFMPTDPNDPNDTPAEMMTGGEEMAGEAMAGEVMAGEAMAGEAVAGEAVAGEVMAGEAVAGENVAGEAVAGEAAAGMDTAVTCEEACDYIADCSIEICEGYDETSREGLLMMCATECNEEFASIAVTQTCSRVVNMIRAQDPVYAEGCEGAMTPAGEDVTPAGEDVTPAGDDVNPAGEDVDPAGEDVDPAGEEMNPAGEEMARGGDDDSGCQSSSAPLGGQRGALWFLCLLGYGAWRRQRVNI